MRHHENVSPVFGAASPKRSVRFLWWDKGDTTQPPFHYRMTRHLFGAASSMGCANIGLKGIADDFEHVHDSDAADFTRDCFYVDDGLCSVPS